MNPIIAVPISIFLGLIFSYATLQKIVSIYRTPNYRVKELPNSGRVLIYGKATVQNIKSPLKQRNCSLWQVEILTPVSGKDRSWRVIYDQLSQEPFELADETGNIQVFPAHAELVLHADFRKASDFLSPLPPRIKSAIEGLGIRTTNALGLERQLRVYERIVKTGDEIYILGEVHFENDSKVIRKGKLPFVISDQGHAKVLGRLYRQVLVNIVFTAIPVALLFLALSNR